MWIYVSHRLSSIEVRSHSIECKQARAWIADWHGVAIPSTHRHSHECHQDGHRGDQAIGNKDVLMVLRRRSSCERMPASQEVQGIASCWRRWSVSMRTLRSHRPASDEELPEANRLRFLAKRCAIQCSEATTEMLQLWSSRPSCAQLYESAQLLHLCWRS